MNVLVNGTLLGLGYCLIAVGMALILGVAKVFDLAYASYYMIAAYVVVGLMPVLMPTVPLWGIFAVAVLVAVALAVATHYLLILPIRKEPTAIMVSTLAVAIVIQELLIFKEGGHPVYMPSVVKGVTRVLGIYVVNTKLLLAVVTIGMMGFIYLFLTRTRLGLAIRSAAEQPEAVLLCGGNIRFIWLSAAALAGLVGGVASLTLGSIYPPHPYMWLDLLVIAFAVMVLGGLGNMWACLPAGLVLGLSEAAFTIYVPYGSIVKRSVGLIIILLVLVLRPTGLFGVKGWEEQSL
jgi:branched-chain amino acid transport system permease protein